MSDINQYWKAAHDYRRTADPEIRHQARVVLLGLALGDSKAGKCAAELLRGEGVAVIRPAVARGTKAI